MKKISQILNRRFRQRIRRKAQRSTRRLQSEQLESRVLLTGGLDQVVHEHHNPMIASDVNQSGEITSGDVLLAFRVAQNNLRSTSAAQGESTGSGQGEPGTNQSIMSDTTNDGRTNILDVFKAIRDYQTGGAPGDAQVEYTHEVTLNGNVIAANSNVNVGDVVIVNSNHQDVRAIGQARFPDLTGPALRGLVGSYNDLVYSANLELRNDVLTDTGGNNVDILFGDDYLLFNTSQNQTKPFPSFEANAVRDVGGVQTDLLSKQEPNGSGVFTIYSAALEVLGGSPTAVDDTANVEEGSANNIIDVLNNDGVTSIITISNEFANGLDNETLTFVADANDLTSQRVPEEEIIFPTTLFNINGIALGGLEITSLTNGTATVDTRGTTDGSDDRLLFTPGKGFTGAAVIEYKINDGAGNFATAKVEINVGPVNDAPINTVPGAQNINEDNTLVFTNGTSISISDVDAGSADVQVDLSVSNGVLNLSGTSNLTSVSGDGSSAISATGTLANLNTALSGLSYAPTLHFNGADVLSLTTNDLGNTGDGGPLSDTDTVDITINPINDAPVNTVPGPQFTVEDDTLFFNPGAFSVSDVDAGGNDITVSLAISTMAGPDVGKLTIGTPGTATVIGNGSDGVQLSGTVGEINSALNTLNYFAPLNLIGDVVLAMDSSDEGNSGTGGPLFDSDTVTITVEQGVSPRPRRDSASGPEGSPITIDALLNDLPTEGFQVFFEGTTNGVNGTVAVDDNGSQGDLTDDKLIYTPTDTNFFGTDTFTYTINDTSGTTTATEAERTGTIDIEITPVNDAPVAVMDSVSGFEDNVLTISFSTLTTNDSPGPANESGQALKVNSVQMDAGQQGTVSIVGTDVIYTPPADFNGTSTFTYTIEDNGQTNGVADPLISGPATVTITVAEDNDDPIAAGDAASIAEDETLTIPLSTLLLNDVPGPSNELTQKLTITEGSFNSTQGGLVSVANGNFVYTPPEDFFGDDTFTYKITDDGTTSGSLDPHSDRGLIEITVTPVNDAPIITVNTDIGVKNVQTTYSGADFLADDLAGPQNEIDAGQTLSVTDVQTATSAGGTLSFANGTFTYNPPTDFTGFDTFSYNVTDDGQTNGIADPLKVPASVTVEVLDFVPSNFGGHVFLDFDGNGVHNNNELPLADVTIHLVGTDFQNQAVNLTTTTADDGSYLFPLVRPGKYDVRQSQPMGILDGVESAGASGNDVFSFDIGLLNGLDSLNNNFGERGLHPAFWWVMNRSTQHDPFGDALVVAGDGSWILALDGWAGVRDLMMTVNGGTVTATAVTQSGSVTRSFTNDPRIQKAIDANSGDSVYRFEGTYNDFFSMNEDSHVEALDDISNEYPEDTCPEDAIFAAEGWA
jgi:hypothetical protein